MSTVKATNLQNGSSATINLITDTSGNVTIGGSTGAGSVKSLTTAKAWANFNGTSSTPITPRSSFNVSSVTKNGTGDYTINMTNSTTDANYAVVGTAGGAAGAVIRAYDDGTARTTNLFRVLTFASTTGTATDYSQVGVQVFGN